jgi:hypothetical protein
MLAIGPALPAHAASCTVTTEGYSHHQVRVCGTQYHRHTTVSHQASPTLPFTGAEVTLMGAVGLGLVAGGTMLVVSGRRRRTVAPTSA